jgi:hypothetical protein
MPGSVCNDFGWDDRARFMMPRHLAVEHTLPWRRYSKCRRLLAHIAQGQIAGRRRTDRRSEFYLNHCAAGSPSPVLAREVRAHSTDDPGQVGKPVKCRETRRGRQVP